MNWKGFKKISAALAVSIALVSGGAVTANADTTGGIGGGGGGGGAYSGFEWVSVVGNKGAVYDEFARLGQWGWQTDSLVNQRIGSNGVSVCRDSNVIWFIRSAQGGWTHNYTGATYGPNAGSIHGSIDVPYSQYGGRGPHVSETNRFKDWDRGQNGYRINGTPGYTIICSGAYTQPPRTWTDGPRDEVTFEGRTDGTVHTAPYSWTTTITRQSLSGDGGKDTVGSENLHSQTSAPMKTEFGKLYDSINTGAGKGMSVAELTAKVNAAKAIDAVAARQTVDLDDANKAGMAEGGILNVSNYARQATISTTEESKVTTTTTCTYVQDWNSYDAKYNPAVKTCSSTNNTDVTRTSSKTTSSTQQLQGFWQMLSVHCNKAEFDALLASDSSLKKISTPDPTNSITGVIYTKNYSSIPSRVDFGSTTNTNAAKAKTGRLNFFDKECPYDCTPTNSTTSGASKNNGGTTNVGALGAESDKINSNIFEFFRDNAAKTIKVDTWFPKSTNGVTYSGEAPVTTTITRDVTGTPSLDGSGGGKFTMKSTNGGSTLFTGSSSSVATQKNWDSSTFSNSAATILRGLHREFTVQSTWASDAGKPQAFNFKWEYAPSVRTTVPVTSVGFGTAGTQRVGTTGSVSANIQGKCYTYFGTAPSSNSIADFGANTGTGTTNKLDLTLLTGDKATAKLTTNFVRAASE